MKLLLLTLLSVLTLNSIVYFVSEVIKEQRISTALKNHLGDLQTHYEILLYHQNITAVTSLDETLKIPEFLEIFSLIDKASRTERILLRNRLQQLLTDKYERLLKQGVLQYHFVLANNESFLRMHKPSRFGDDLSLIRKDFKLVNKTHKKVRAFAQGRTAHGFRNIFPIFAKDGRYLGAMEVSFSSDEFIKYLTKVSKIHTHFLVDKNIFESKAWSRDDIVVNYSDSKEHKGFMVSIENNHESTRCVYNNELFSKYIKNKMKLGIEKEKNFSLVWEKDDTKIAISFLAVKDLENTKTVAWFVSYVECSLMSSAYKDIFIIRVLLFMFVSLLAYLIYKMIYKQRENMLLIKEKAYIDGLTGVYNRNKFDIRASREMQRSIRYKNQLGMAILDIDHFKIFNDTYGHLVGDEVLILLAQSLNKQVRVTDTFARWGGEEFVILFPETGLEEVEIICEKLRQEVESLNHPTAGKITVSFGVTCYVKGDTVESFFGRCDEALYNAKENGRNKVSVL